MRAPQSRAPLPVGHEDLSDVAGHRREIHLERGQVCRLGLDPSHPPGTGLGPSQVERRGCRIHPNDLDATACEQAGECSRPAPDVQDGAGTELSGDRGVDVEVAPVRIQGIVDRRQPWLLEQRISHNRDGKHGRVQLATDLSALQRS
jgi:hypothetical protein